MKNNKERIKMKSYFTEMMRLFVVIMCVFLWSCGGSEGSTSTAIEPEEGEEVNAPIIQTPTPLIHLADNLDEQDQLGWCIDTRGNGFNQELHTHSCKPSGGDVQFIYNEETLQVCSAEFDDFCIEMLEGSFAGTSLSLVQSSPSSPDQKFVYNEDNGEINPEADTNLCLAAGDTSAVAGIYMSRSLTLEISSETEESLKTWVILK